MSKNTFVVVGVALAVGFSVAVFVKHFRKVGVERPTKMVPVSYGDLRTFRYHSPVRRNLTPVESNAVRVAYLRITDAYTNGTVGELRQRIEEMPSVVTNMQDRLYAELERPFHSLFNERFLWSQKVLDFQDCSSFERFGETNLLVAKFLGNMVMRRGEGANGILMVYDRNVLCQLKSYRDKFEHENRKDFVDVADRLIEDWIDQIDSEFGFTRWFMWHDLDNNWDHVAEGSMTRANLLECIRRWADGLIKAGHTPKWLDEFNDRPDLKWKYVPPKQR